MKKQIVDKNTNQQMFLLLLFDWFRFDANIYTKETDEKIQSSSTSHQTFVILKNNLLKTCNLYRSIDYLR